LLVPSDDELLLWECVCASCAYVSVRHVFAEFPLLLGE